MKPYESQALRVLFGDAYGRLPPLRRLLGGQSVAQRYGPAEAERRDRVVELYMAWITDELPGRSPEGRFHARSFAYSQRTFLNKHGEHIIGERVISQIQLRTAKRTLNRWQRDYLKRKPGSIFSIMMQRRRAVVSRGFYKKRVT